MRPYIYFYDRSDGVCYVAKDMTYTAFAEKVEDEYGLRINTAYISQSSKIPSVNTGHKLIWIE